MKFKIFNWEISFYHKIYKNRWLLNFVPMMGAVDVAEDSYPHATAGRWYNFNWLTFGIYLYRQENNRLEFKPGWLFPSSKFIDWIISFHGK